MAHHPSTPPLSSCRLSSSRPWLAPSGRVCLTTSTCATVTDSLTATVRSTICDDEGKGRRSQWLRLSVIDTERFSCATPVLSSNHYNYAEILGKQLQTDLLVHWRRCCSSCSARSITADIWSCVPPGTAGVVRRCKLPGVASCRAIAKIENLQASSPGISRVQRGARACKRRTILPPAWVWLSPSPPPAVAVLY